MPDKVPNSSKTADPKPMSLSSQVCTSSPPVISDPIVLEEHQLASDKVKLQLRPDLQQRSIVVWMLTPVGRPLPGDSFRAVEVEATQPIAITAVKNISYLIL